VKTPWPLPLVKRSSQYAMIARPWFRPGRHVLSHQRFSLVKLMTAFEFTHADVYCVP
jgi:hypothetical protein